MPDFPTEPAYDEGDVRRLEAAATPSGLFDSARLRRRESGAMV
jgi:hypothetical protein